MWNDPTDRETLVTEALAGSEAAWTRLYHHYRPLCTCTLRRRKHFTLHNGDDCISEVINDVFAKLKQKALRQYDPTRALLPFLLKLTSRAGSDHIPTCIGKLNLTDEEEGTIPDPSSLAEWQEARNELLRLLAWLDQTLERMPEGARDRLIFTLYYRDGLEAKDIARRLNMKVREVFSRLDAIRAMALRWREKND